MFSRGVEYTHLVLFYHVPRVTIARVIIPCIRDCIVATHVIVMNMCRHKRAINIRYSPASNLQKHVKLSPQQ